MAETRKTRTPLDRDYPGFICLYLVRDAAPNERNRTRIDADSGSRAQRSEFGDTILRFGLAHCTDTRPDNWQIRRSEVGGPMVQKSPLEQHRFHLSLSHSGDYLVAGICNAAPLGIDIERNCERRFTEIARHLEWPEMTWAPRGSLPADGFYHLWTLWEASIKSCSTEPGAVAESVFKRIVTELNVGMPHNIRTHDWFARSWQCPEHFWLSAVTPNMNISDSRLFVVNGLTSVNKTPQINEITNDEGFLDPKIFEHENQ